MQCSCRPFLAYCITNERPNSSDWSQTVRLSPLYKLLLSVVFSLTKIHTPVSPRSPMLNSSSSSAHKSFAPQWPFFFFLINLRRHACVLLCCDRALTCGPPPCLGEAVSGCGLGCLPIQWLPVWAGRYLGGQVEVCCLTSSMWPRSGMGAADRRLCPVSDWGLGLVTGPSVLSVSGYPPPKTSSTSPTFLFLPAPGDASGSGSG